ncbi:hypothetical protein D3C76_1551900 [compost metagenome]
MAQRPLRRNTCEGCGRIHYSRSPLTRFCSSTCQSRTWKKNNTATQEQLEAEYLAQEAATTSKQLQEGVQ